MNKLYVITGGPGMGKTAITQHLQKEGYLSVPEAGRAIIQQQVMLGTDAVPWMNKLKFAELMFERSLRDYKSASVNGMPVFFDRGIHDIIGYLTLNNINIPGDMLSIVKDYRYNRKVFITPPWKEIYVNDTERKQSFEEAVATYEMMNRIYTSHHYEVIEVPKMTVEQRAAFIIANI